MNIRVKWMSFVLSFSAHAAIIAAPIFFTAGSVEKERKVDVKIQYILPPIEEIKEEKQMVRQEKQEAKTEEKKKTVKQKTATEMPAVQPVLEQRPAVVNEDELKEAAFRYQDMIKQKIQAERVYPPWAEKNGIEGDIRICFTVGHDGYIRHINIINPSGHSILDNEAVSTVKRAGPFPEFPQCLNLPYMQIDVTIVYRLN